MVAGISWVNPNKNSRDILCKTKGDHLDWVLSDQMILKMIKRGTLGLSGSSPLRLDGSRDSQAGCCSIWMEAKLKGYIFWNTQVRVRKQL